MNKLWLSWMLSKKKINYCRKNKERSASPKNNSSTSLHKKPKLLIKDVKSWRSNFWGRSKPPSPWTPKPSQSNILLREPIIISIRSTKSKYDIPNSLKFD